MNIKEISSGEYEGDNEKYSITLVKEYDEGKEGMKLYVTYKDGYYWGDLKIMEVVNFIESNNLPKLWWITTLN